MKISQVSKLSGRGQSLLAKILEIAPIFQHAEFRLDASSYNSVPDKDNFTGSAARAENDPLQRDLQVPEVIARALAMYGRELTIDDVRLMDKNVGMSPTGLRMLLDRRLSGLAVKLGTEVQAQMFVGTDANKEMLGISNFVKDAAAGGQTEKLGFTADEIAAMNKQVSLKLDTTANQESFVEELYKELGNVPGANAIVCNTNLAARLTSIAKKMGAAGESVNSFGKPVVLFNNVPIVPLGVSAIPQTESDGTNSDCTSLYVIRFAEELGAAFSTNSGFYFTDFENLETKPQGMARLQFFLNLTVDRADALKRLSRIRL